MRLATRFTPCFVLISILTLAVAPGAADAGTHRGTGNSHPTTRGATPAAPAAFTIVKTSNATDLVQCLLGPAVSVSNAPPKVIRSLHEELSVECCTLTPTAPSDAVLWALQK